MILIELISVLIILTYFIKDLKPQNYKNTASGSYQFGSISDSSTNGERP